MCHIRSKAFQESLPPQGKPDHARVSFFGRQGAHQSCFLESKSFIDNLLVQIYFIVVMIRWTGLEQM